jgi:glycosyltransferase involved in cell wall biosynthesis
MKPFLSLCMVVKNEEHTLARCLDSIQGLVDEIIIVNTGSTDATKEIAAKFGSKIHDYTWTKDFQRHGMSRSPESNGKMVPCIRCRRICPKYEDIKAYKIKTRKLPLYKCARCHHHRNSSYMLTCIVELVG